MFDTRSDMCVTDPGVIYGFLSEYGYVDPVGVKEGFLRVIRGRFQYELYSYTENSEMCIRLLEREDGSKTWDIYARIDPDPVHPCQYPRSIEPYGWSVVQ